MTPSRCRLLLYGEVGRHFPEGVDVEPWVRVRVHKPSHMGIFVELLGEFDVGTRRILGRTLSSLASWGQPVYVDLSGVTFMDSSCLWEIAVQHRRHRDHLALCNPSPQVELSVAACDLEGWIAFRPRKNSAPRTTGESPSAPREKSIEAAKGAGCKGLLDKRQVRKGRATDVPFRRRGLRD